MTWHLMAHLRLKSKKEKVILWGKIELISGQKVEAQSVSKASPVPHASKRLLGWMMSVNSFY